MHSKEGSEGYTKWKNIKGGGVSKTEATSISTSSGVFFFYFMLASTFIGSGTRQDAHAYS